MKNLQKQLLDIFDNVEKPYFYVLEALHDFVEFDNIAKSGVYMLGDFYIGKSSNIPGRVANHLIEQFNMKDRNQAKCHIIANLLGNGVKIRVSILSEDVMDESGMILEYLRNGYRLTNKKMVGAKELAVDFSGTYPDPPSCHGCYLSSIGIVKKVAHTCLSNSEIMFVKSLKFTNNIS